ncbi:unnamed protein product [Didymodactylos carnosus]|uniref:Uncharacterized protein n=1 Tax=Didymodactylos carnosus TaxID=1234261 RepID=A0A814BI65_9BILA|nr:unnamed protein product [Didymodactylos carnosus]CAF0978410.1 unnamed protein product [Didymodactylos carnosus]CAF3705573.1 unnamed protein product [Didymodactylos carnosus]CAF3749035.1 unnamed protein product [Didymodactylos carnosus]
MHIFPSETTYKEKVVDFIKLLPLNVNDLPHFYIFASPKSYKENYDYETQPEKILHNSREWDRPYVGGSRSSSSVLLSALCALRMFFHPINDIEDGDEAYRNALLHVGYRKALEAQFFIHLREYLFFPAVLALKHVMEGTVFKFEKQLLAASLADLLRLFCSPAVRDEHILYYTPLLFSWLLNKCNVESSETDSFQIVELRQQTTTMAYFVNPITRPGIKKNNQLLLEELTEENDLHCIRHLGK